MRRRIIDGERFFRDPDLARLLDPTGRLFYIGLISIAEDSGVFEADILGLKMAIFPADDIPEEQLRGYYQALVDSGKVIEYEAEGKRLGWLRNFHRYQNLSRPAAPTLPLPEWVLWHGDSPKRHERYYEVLLFVNNDENRGETEEGEAIMSFRGNTTDIFIPYQDMTESCHDNDASCQSHSPDMIEEKRKEKKRKEVVAGKSCIDKHSYNNIGKDTYIEYPRLTRHLISTIEESWGAPYVTSQLLRQVSGALVSGYSPEWVEEAIVETANYGKRSWKYAEAILSRWKREGKDEQKTPIYDPDGVDVVEVWDKDTWRERCGELEKKGEKWCMKKT